MADTTLRVNCWLTPEKIPAVATGRGDAAQGTFYLLPLTYAGPTAVRPLPATVRLLKPADHPIKAKFPPTLTVGHVWSPDPAAPGAAPPYLAQSVQVSAPLPRTCFWSGSQITFERSVGGASLPPTPGSGPVGQSQDDSLLQPRSGWLVSGLHPVPGERLVLEHDTYPSGPYQTSAWHTCRGLSGGTVIAKRANATVADSYLYDLSVQGGVFSNVMPSDFTEYFVGDWVYVLRHGTEAADMTFPATVGNAPAAGESLRIVPLIIMGVS